MLQMKENELDQITNEVVKIIINSKVTFFEAKEILRSVQIELLNYKLTSERAQD